MSIVLFVLIFGIVVVAHEFGHFIVAKLNGIRVLEFSVGMGPNLFSFQKGETKYCLKLLPIGGACMFDGEDGVAKEEGEIDEHSFLKANVWSRIACVAAGPIFNFILAYVVSVILVSFAAIGYPILADVMEGMPAEEAGLQAGDELISINGERVYLYQDVMLISQLNKGQELDIVYERDGERAEVTLVPRFDETEQRYLIGIAGCEYGACEGLEVFEYGYYQLRYSVVSTFKSLGMLVTGQLEKDDVAGPIGIANMVGDTYEATKESGWETVALNMMNIVVILSVSLGIMNLLPLPALDGGRLVFMFVEVVRGKPVSPEKEGMVHFAGFVLLMVLMVFVVFNDISNIIN